MRATLLLLIATLTAMISASISVYPATADGEPLLILVTNSGDSLVEGETECPHETNCTLRRAIELANADETLAIITIQFDPAAFDSDNPVRIALQAALPALEHADVTLESSTAGVVIDGAGLAGVTDGLVAAGANFAAIGFAIENFPGSCLMVSEANAVIGGNSDDELGVRLAFCGTGLELAGANARVMGNRFGFGAGGEAANVAIGILVTAPGSQIGGVTTAAGLRNHIGNAGIGIRVGTGGGEAFGGTVIRHNVIGKSENGQPAAVETAIDLRQPSTATLVLENTIANATTGVRLAAESLAVNTTSNRIQGNRFESIGGMAIDLNGDGVRNQNDEGDPDAGPNTLLNHAVITRAVQSRIEGTACASCTVQIYFAAHRVGAERDYGSLVLPGGTVVADAGGLFALNTPPVAPGQWVIALATDTEGNTSEFGPSARVGSGIVQCGNVDLQPGWNHAGFFGGASLPLGNEFPPGEGESKIASIYHLTDGTMGYTHWFAETSVGRTLDALQTGEAYWYQANVGVTLQGGFALTVAVPVQLQPGWNDFVYIGGSADVRDALSSIAGQYTEVYRWEAQAGGEWLTFGREDTPEWARQFTQMQSCQAYTVFMTEGATLLPLQP